MATTLKSVNKALKEAFGDLELVHGKDCYYFSGDISNEMYASGFYDGSNMKNSTPEFFVEEARRRIERRI